MLTYREMVVADLPAAFEVRLSTVENAMTMEQLAEDYGMTPESLAASLATDVRGWLCEDDGMAVGFSMADRSNAEIQVVAVRPSHEGRGIGGALLGSATDWLFAEGHAEIWLGANPDPKVRATGFYRRYGWQATERFFRGNQILTLRRP